MLSKIHFQYNFPAGTSINVTLLPYFTINPTNLIAAQPLKKLSPP